MKTEKLMSILGKNEITIYEAGQLFEMIGATFKEIHQATWRDAEGVVDSAEHMLKEAKAVLAKISEVNDQIDAASLEIYDKHEAAYKAYYKARTEVAKRIENLPPIKYPDTYSFERVHEAACKLGNLSDKQWGRVIELAKALTSGE